MAKHELTRRAFLAAATTTAVAAWPRRVNAAKVVPRKISPNEKMNVAAIGAGGKGLGDIMNCKSENVVALCDADWARAAEAFYRLKGAKRFWDYRKMLEEMDAAVDACTVSTPDHMHAPAAHMAMKMGKHVYVQKPLTHTIKEAVLLTKTAREMGVATQMGNQGQAGDAVRTLCEMIWSGAIGKVTEVHIWTDRPGDIWKQGIPEPPPGEPVRDKLNWELWIGPAEMRPYNGGYCPRAWRGWWDFGCGALGDMGCHNMNPVWRACKLGEAETFTVETVRETGNNTHTGPVSSAIRYQFPARGEMPPVTVTWYDGGLKPERPEGLPADAKLGAAEDPENGSLFVGEDGFLTCGCHGDGVRLVPDERMQGYKPPEPWLERIPNESPYVDWMRACKGGQPACSNFDYAGPLTEFVNMGNVALRAGRKVTYSLASHSVVDDEAANALLTKTYRAGWKLPV